MSCNFYSALGEDLNDTPRCAQAFDFVISENNRVRKNGHLFRQHRFFDGKTDRGSETLDDRPNLVQYNI